MLGAAGGILTTVGMFLLSASAGPGGYGEGKFWAIWLTQGLLVGLGMSCKFVYSSQVVAGWFVQRRGLAIGITASGASIGKPPLEISCLCYSLTHDLSWPGLSRPLQIRRSQRRLSNGSAVLRDPRWRHVTHRLFLRNTKPSCDVASPRKVAQARGVD